MGASINTFFGRIALSRARSFIVYQSRYASSFAARFLAVLARHGGVQPSGAGARSSRPARPKCFASPCPACHTEIL